MLIAPQITTPVENAQFNLGSVSITWEAAAAIDFTDYGGAEQFRLDYNVDVDDSRWVEIQAMLEDAAEDSAYGGKEYIQELFTDPASKSISVPIVTPTDFREDLGDFSVTQISSVYNDNFEFTIVSETGKRYKIYANGLPTHDIIVELESQAEPLDSYFLTYELEYTDDWKDENTVWSTIKRRIPASDTSLTWAVGKMIKSDKVRLRMRTKYMTTEETSPWSVSQLFSINVFRLVAPAIVSPMSDILYSDFLMIILDESQTQNTFHQKVRYTLEYSSLKQETGWNMIVKDIPPGQNIIRWNLDDVQSSDDYTLRLTVQNVSTSCNDTESNPDQIDRAFVHNIRIQQSGMFIVDTIPPQAVLEIGDTGQVTNQLNQVLSIFAEDATTDIRQIQLRECDVGNSLLLGELDANSVKDLSGSKEDVGLPGEGTVSDEQCPAPVDLMDTRNFETLITDSPIGNLSKMQWVFDELDTDGNPVSAVKKIEALLTDMGGNTSLQERTKVFLPIYNDAVAINDFAIVIEQREQFSLDGSTTIKRETAVYEVAYVGTSAGELWVLEPYARLLYTISDHPNIVKLFEFSDSLYLFAYNSSTDKGAVYRHDGSEPTLMKEFDAGLGLATGMAEYGDSLYIGLQNGNLWKYNGFAFSLNKSFDEPIQTLFGDKNYLYVGFQNSNNLVLYNGTDYIELSVD